MARARVWLARTLVTRPGDRARPVRCRSVRKGAGLEQLTIVVKTQRFETRLLRNCDLFSVNGSGTANFKASEDGPALGALNLVQRSGKVYSKAHAWQVERFRLPGERGNQRSTSFTDLGIALQKHTLFLTGRNSPGPVLIAGARRVKLAVVRRAKIEEAPLLDARKQAVPDTFAFSGAALGESIDGGIKIDTAFTTLGPAG